MLSGEDAFLLSDTFGFPIDLTKEILSEKGMSVDEDRFRALVLQQRETARASRKNAGADAWAGDSDVLDDIAKTEFGRLHRYEGNRKGHGYRERWRTR